MLKPDVDGARHDLYALTPMEQFQRLQLMDEATEDQAVCPSEHSHEHEKQRAGGPWPQSNFG